MTERISHAPAGGLDQAFHAVIASAYTDWLQLLALSPDKQLALFMQGMCNRQTLFALGTESYAPGTYVFER